MQKPGIQSINTTSIVLTQFRSQNPFGVFTWNFTFRAQIWYGTLTVVMIFWWPANAVCFMAINLHNLMNANIARKYVDNRHLDNAVHIIINALVIKTGITDEALKSYHVENENDMIWCYWSNPYMTFTKFESILGAVSIWRCHLTSIGIHILEIRRSRLKIHYWSYHIH